MLCLFSGLASAALPRWFTDQARRGSLPNPVRVHVVGDTAYLCWIITQNPWRRTSPQWAGIRISLTADNAGAWTAADAQHCDPNYWMF